MKKVSLLITFIFTILLFSTQVNASFDFTHNGNDYSVPDLPANSETFDSTYFSIFRNGNAYTILSYVGYDPTTMKAVNTNQGTGYMGIVDLEGNLQDTCKIYFWEYDSSDSTATWTLAGWQPNGGFYQYYSSAETADKFIYSTVNIYFATGNYGGVVISEDFFFTATKKYYQIPIVAEVEQIPTVMVGTLKVIIPVGLVVLSMVLLISLIKLVISRVK